MKVLDFPCIYCKMMSYDKIINRKTNEENMRRNTRRLTESEFRSLVSRTTRRILREGLRDALPALSDMEPTMAVRKLADRGRWNDIAEDDEWYAIAKGMFKNGELPDWQFDSIREYRRRYGKVDENRRPKRMR